VGRVACLTVSRDGGTVGGAGTAILGDRNLVGEIGEGGALVAAEDEGAGDSWELDVAAELGGASTLGLTVSRKMRPVPTGRAVFVESTVLSPKSVRELMDNRFSCSRGV
jgi:hypothetical protein